MLADAARYMQALEQIDDCLDHLQSLILNPRVPDRECRDFRLRHQQLADVRALITGDAATLPHS